jgi:hypothetical protein
LGAVHAAQFDKGSFLLQCRVYALVLLGVSALIFFLLLQINGILALGFFLTAVVSIPALVIHRREAAYAPEIGPDAESVRWGWLRLAGLLSLDITGLALGVLLLILLILALHQFVPSGHRH